MKQKVTKPKATKKNSSAVPKKVKQEEDDLFKLITSNRNLQKKMASINALPIGHASLSEIRASTKDPSIKYCTPFMWAVYKCEFELARCLIERSADWHPSCYMAITNRLKDGIVTQNPTSDKPNLREISPFEMIAAKNGVSLLRFMHQQQLIADINQVVNQSFQTMVHIATKYGHRAMIDLLAELHASLDLEDCNNTRPLVFACNFGYENVVACLLNHSVSVQFNVGDVSFLTWFDYKSKDPNQTIGLPITNEKIEVGPRNFVAIAKLLEGSSPTQDDNLMKLIQFIENKAFKEALVAFTSYTGDIDALTEHHGRSILHKVASHVSDDDNDGYEFAKAVFARTPNINIRSKPGKTNEDPGFTPLHLACESGHYKMVILLLCHQAKIDCTTDSGFTPLHLAAMMERILIVHYLCKRYQQLGFSIDPLSKDEITPLILAVVHRKTESVRVLLSYGADPTRPSRLAGSVILVAMDQRHGKFIPEILALLIQECLKRPHQKIDLKPVADKADVPQQQPLHTAPDFFFPKEFILMGDMGLCAHNQDEYGLNELSNIFSRIKEYRNKWLSNLDKFQRDAESAIWIGEAPIFFAIATECLPAIEMLMQNDSYRSPLSSSNADTNIAYKIAFELNKSKSLKVIVDQLIKQPTEIPLKIPLYIFILAIALDQTTIVRIFLESGCVENLNRHDFFLIVTLMKFSNEATFRELIRCGFDFNDNYNTFWWSALGFLIANRKFKLVRCLLEEKYVDVNKPSRDSSTALMQACSLEDQQLSIQFINLLLKHDADCMATHKSGLNALHIAILLNNTPAAKALVLHQPSLVSNALIMLANGKTTSLAHLCILNDAFWLIHHRQLMNQKTFTQPDSEGLSVRDIARDRCDVEVIKLIDEVCVEKTESGQTFDIAKSHENYTGREYSLKVLGFSATEFQKLRSARKATRPNPALNQNSADPPVAPATFFSGRFTLFNNMSRLGRTENIQIVADWQAIGEINEEELRSFKTVLEKPKLVVTGVGVKYIGRHIMQIRLSDDTPYSEYPCQYEIKIANSKARLLCVQINADTKDGPLLLVACHYMPRGLHTQRDTKRLDEVIQKTLRLIDNKVDDNKPHNNNLN